MGGISGLEEGANAIFKNVVERCIAIIKTSHGSFYSTIGGLFFYCPFFTDLFSSRSVALSDALSAIISTFFF